MQDASLSYIGNREHAPASGPYPATEAPKPAERTARYATTHASPDGTCTRCARYGWHVPADHDHCSQCDGAMPDHGTCAWCGHARATREAR